MEYTLFYESKFYIYKEYTVKIVNKGDTFELYKLAYWPTMRAKLNFITETMLLKQMELVVLMSILSRAGIITKLLHALDSGFMVQNTLKVKERQIMHIMEFQEVFLIMICLMVALKLMDYYSLIPKNLLILE